MNDIRDIERGIPGEEQLILILENLFDKQRLIGACQPLFHQSG